MLAFSPASMRASKQMCGTFISTAYGNLLWNAKGGNSLMRYFGIKRDGLQIGKPSSHKAWN